MIKVGVTGGIGSGKSMVCQVFAKLGIPVFNADLAAKKLMDEDQILKQQLIDTFGEDIYTPEGLLDRKKLAGIIFNDQLALQKVNALVHPFVREHFDQWAEKQNAPYVIQEAAILFESGQAERFNKTVLVIAPEEVRIERVMQRDNTTHEKVLERMANQLPDKEKIGKADFVVLNNGEAMVLPQIIEIHQKLLNNGKIW
jgi:dephospho-CoA kinase